MSGKLKADYQTGETQVILPADFLGQPRHVQQVFLKGWIQNLIDQLNAAAEHETAILEKVAVEQDDAPDEVAAEQDDTPLPPTDKPKRGKKASKE